VLPSSVFKTDAINHSTTSPIESIISGRIFGVNPPGRGVVL
jgi:hypothetical protein